MGPQHRDSLTRTLAHPLLTATAKACRKRRRNPDRNLYRELTFNARLHYSKRAVLWWIRGRVGVLPSIALLKQHRYQRHGPQWQVGGMAREQTWMRGHLVVRIVVSVSGCGIGRMP